MNNILINNTFKKKSKKSKKNNKIISKYKSLKKKYSNYYKKIYNLNKEKCNKKTVPEKIKLYSNLCNYSYELKKPKTYKKYKLDENYNTKYYQCYYNKKKCIIVFRGTQLDKRDFLMDYDILKNNMKHSKYFNNAIDITNKIITKYNKHKIILTGHSLGGSISLFVMHTLKSKIYKTYVFNPGITLFPYKNNILKEYCSNENNYFIINLGDIISNSILLYNPKNLICLKSEISNNPVELHTITVFI